MSLTPAEQAVFDHARQKGHDPLLAIAQHWWDDTALADAIATIRKYREAAKVRLHASTYGATSLAAEAAHMLEDPTPDAEAMLAVFGQIDTADTRRMDGLSRQGASICAICGIPFDVHPEAFGMPPGRLSNCMQGNMGSTGECQVCNGTCPSIHPFVPRVG